MDKNIKKIIYLLLFFSFFTISEKCSALELTPQCKNASGRACGVCSAFEPALENIGKKDCEGSSRVLCCVTKCGAEGTLEASCVDTSKIKCLEEESAGLGYCKHQNPNSVCCHKAEEGSRCEGKPNGYKCEENGKDGICFDEKCETESGVSGEKCGSGGENTLGVCKEVSNCSGHQITSGRKCKGTNIICCKDKPECETKYNGKCTTVPVSDSSSAKGVCQIKFGDSYEKASGSLGCPGSSGRLAVCCSPKEPSDCDVCGDPSCPTGYKPSPIINNVCGERSCCLEESGATTKTDYGYKNPLSVNSLTEWIYNLLGSIQGIVGWLAVIMIVLGGVVYILSGGSEKQTTLAKSIILWALVGFAIAVAAPALMKGIKDLIAGSGSGTSTDIIDNANSVKQIVTNISTFLLGTIGILALISFAVGGLMYLFSGGDSNRTDTAKRIIFYSIIAIVVSGAGVILLRQVMNILEASA